MTVIPGWLGAVLAAATSSGPMALAGALLGMLAATRSAERTAQLSRQDEQRRWNRERRETAYLGFLKARNGLIRLMEAEYDQLNRGEEATSMEEGDARLAALRDVFGALPIVELFGSQRAAAAARKWADDLYVWGEQPTPSLELYKRIQTQWFETFGDEARMHRDPFIGLVRAELGVQDE